RTPGDDGCPTEGRGREPRPQSDGDAARWRGGLFRHRHRDDFGEDAPSRRRLFDGGVRGTGGGSSPPVHPGSRPLPVGGGSAAGEGAARGGAFPRQVLFGPPLPERRGDNQLLDQRGGILIDFLSRRFPFITGLTFGQNPNILSNVAP